MTAKDIPQQTISLICRILSALFSIACFMFIWAQSASAQNVEINLPAQPLGSALTQLATQTGVLVGVDASLVAGKQGASVNGYYTPQQAFTQLLAGSGLVAAETTPGRFVLESLPVNRQAIRDTETVKLPEMTITGMMEENSPYNTSYTLPTAAAVNKTDTPIMKTPASIQVVPKSVMHDQQAYRLQDVIKNVSGVQTFHGFGGGAQSFIVRGFLQSSLNYRNGIRIPATKFDLANVERVEVLKGTSAMLHGFGDPGGIISTVTKQPSSEPHYSVEQRFGSYNFFRTEASATGPLSKEHGLNYRVDLSYLDTDSFRQLISSDRIFFAPTLSWQPTADTKLILSYEYFDEKNGYDYGTPAFGNRLADIPRSRTFTNRGLQDKQTTHLIDFRIDHRLNDKIRFNAGTVASQNSKQWNSIYTGRVVERLDPLNSGRQIGDVDRFFWFGPEKIETLTAWMNGIFDFETYGIQHKVLFGGEYYTAHFNYDIANGAADTVNIFTFDPRRSNLPIDQYRNLPTDSFHASTDSTSKAIYLQDQITFGGNFHILGGFRYDWVDRRQNLSWWAPNHKDARNDGFVSPRVGILYEPASWLSVFGNFSESFGPAFAYDSGQERLFKFDSATQYEGGVKAQFFDGKLIANAAYFDLQKTQRFTDPNGQNILSTVPVRGKSNGVEFDMQGQIYRGLSMIGTYAYTHTKVLDDPTSPGNVGNRLPYVPEHQGSLWLKYDFNYGFLKGFTVGGGVFVASRRFGDAANSFSDGAYAQLDLMAAYRKKLGKTLLTAQLNLNNINNEKYYYLRSRRTNLPAEPLMVMGSIRLQY